MNSFQCFILLMIIHFYLILFASKKILYNIATCYMLECLTEREQAKHVSTLVITENKTTLLCQLRYQALSCARK